MTFSNSSIITQADRDRFMSYVDSDASTGAWLWMGGISSSGYGAFWFRGTTISAHRFAWLAFKGSIQDGMNVCHKHESLGRHNVNPDHLFLGTDTDNMQDAAAKGRTMKGERNSRSVLSADAAKEIYESSETCKVLSDRYGVSGPVISKIRRGKMWLCATQARPATTHNLGNKSGYPGVRLRKGGWEASIGRRENNKYQSRYLGRYKTAEAAHAAYVAEKERINSLAP